MRVVVITTSLKGTASHHLPKVLSAKGVEVVAVIRSTGAAPVKKKRFVKRLEKIVKIGVAGAINGIRMRKWYNENLGTLLNIKPLDEACREAGVSFIEVPYTNSIETQNALKHLSPDIAISLGNGYLSSKVFSIPRLGMLNIHHEILPDYQNAQSVIWQIYNGSSHSGYTIHKIDKHIDTGDILLQETVPINFKNKLGDTVTYTLADVYERSAEGLKKVLENYSYYESASKPQGPGVKYTTPSFLKFLHILYNHHRLKSK